MGKFCKECGRELHDGDICPVCHPNQVVKQETNANPVVPTKPKGIRGFFWCWKGENYKLLSKRQKLSFIGIVMALIVCVGAIPGLIIAVSSLISDVDSTPVIETSSSISQTEQEKLYKDIIESSDNSRGMRFKITLSEFVERYNQAIAVDENDIFITLYSLDIQEAKTVDQNDEFDTKMFEVYDVYNQPIFAIILNCEKQSQKIVDLSFMIISTEFNSLDQSGKEGIMRCKNYACSVLDTSLTFNQIDSNWQTALTSESTRGSYFDKGIVYSFVSQDIYDYFNFGAVTYDYYENVLLG